MLGRLLDSDDRGVELAHAVCVLAVTVFLGLAVFDVVWRGRPFDMQSFGTGLGLVMTATGVAAVAQGLQRKAQGPPAG